MNRHERRAANKLAAKAKEIDPVVAAHEAGHAVARYLTANEMGFDVSEAIKEIVVHNAPSIFVEPIKPGVGSLVAEATTYGPMLSKEMEPRPEEIAQLISLKPTKKMFVSAAREKGADIYAWLNARLLIMLFGPMAEARFTKRPLDDVMRSFECSGDVNDINSDCDAAGVSGEEKQVLINLAIKRGTSMLDRPEVCSALDQLAAAIIKRGSMSGKHASMIIGSAICMT